MNDRFDENAPGKSDAGANSCCGCAGGCGTGATSGKTGRSGWRTVVFAILALLAAFIIVQALLANRTPASAEEITWTVESRFPCEGNIS